jgi:hypothetical protein
MMSAGPPGLPLLHRVAAMLSLARPLTFAGNRAHRVITFEQAACEIAQPAPRAAGL